MKYHSIEILTDIYKDALYQSMTHVNSAKRRIEVSMTVCNESVIDYKAKKLHEHVQRVRIEGYYKKIKKGD